jgi:cytochrome c-type biogenesis protein
MRLLAEVAGSFAIGVGTPLTAACALPLYPGFVAYLAGRSEDGLGSPGLLGGAVVAGVVTFMLVVGLVFSTVLETSLTSVIGVVSPIAFAILLGIGVALLFDVRLTERVPTLEPPQSQHPVVAAFAYGAFFGAIVIPCNPALIAIFFARAFLFETPLSSMLNFFAFGLGIGAPLLALALVSQASGQRITRGLARHRTAINRVSGVIMIAISGYYLLFVFDVLGLGLDSPI